MAPSHRLLRQPRAADRPGSVEVVVPFREDEMRRWPHRERMASVTSGFEEAPERLAPMVESGPVESQAANGEGERDYQRVMGGDEVEVVDIEMDRITTKVVSLCLTNAIQSNMGKSSRVGEGQALRTAQSQRICINIPTHPSRKSRCHQNSDIVSPRRLPRMSHLPY